MTSKRFKSAKINFNFSDDSDDETQRGDPWNICQDLESKSKCQKLSPALLHSATDTCILASSNLHNMCELPSPCQEFELPLMESTRLQNSSTDLPMFPYSEDLERVDLLLKSLKVTDQEKPEEQADGQSHRLKSSNPLMCKDTKLGTKNYMPQNSKAESEQRTRKGNESIPLMERSSDNKIKTMKSFEKCTAENTKMVNLPETPLKPYVSFEKYTLTKLEPTSMQEFTLGKSRIHPRTHGNLSVNVVRTEYKVDDLKDTVKDVNIECKFDDVKDICDHLLNDTLSFGSFFEVQDISVQTSLLADDINSSTEIQRNETDSALNDEQNNVLMKCSDSELSSSVEEVHSPQQAHISDNENRKSMVVQNDSSCYGYMSHMESGNSNVFYSNFPSCKSSLDSDNIQKLNGEKEHLLSGEQQSTEFSLLQEISYSESSRDCATRYSKKFSDNMLHIDASEQSFYEVKDVSIQTSLVGPIASNTSIVASSLDETNHSGSECSVKSTLYKTAYEIFGDERNLYNISDFELQKNSDGSDLSQKRNTVSVNLYETAVENMIVNTKNSISLLKCDQNCSSSESSKNQFLYTKSHHQESESHPLSQSHILVTETDSENENKDTDDQNNCFGLVVNSINESDLQLNSDLDNSEDSSAHCTFAKHICNTSLDKKMKNKKHVDTTDKKCVGALEDFEEWEKTQKTKLYKVAALTNVSSNSESDSRNKANEIEQCSDSEPGDMDEQELFMLPSSKCVKESGKELEAVASARISRKVSDSSDGDSDFEKFLKKIKNNVKPAKLTEKEIEFIVDDDDDEEEDNNGNGSSETDAEDEDSDDFYIKANNVLDTKNRHQKVVYAQPCSNSSTSASDLDDVFLDKPKRNNGNETKSLIRVLQLSSDDDSLLETDRLNKETSIIVSSDQQGSNVKAPNNGSFAGSKHERQRLGKENFLLEENSSHTNDSIREALSTGSFKTPFQISKREKFWEKPFENSGFHKGKDHKTPTMSPGPKPYPATISHSACPSKVGLDDDAHFLQSLTVKYAEHKRHLDAAKYMKKFKTLKGELAQKLFRIFNHAVFENKLPKDFEIEWSTRYTKTAGTFHFKGTANNFKTKVTLSVKICDNPERVRDTLAHELCHAAVKMINNVNEGHGKFWKSWARKTNKTFPFMPVIARCHHYSINTKYTYQCVNCKYRIRRHSKSLDTDRKVCGRCMGKFEVFLTNELNSSTESCKMLATPRTPRTPNKFALYVKECYSEVKKREGLKHADVMRILSKEFAEKNKISE